MSDLENLQSEILDQIAADEVNRAKPAGAKGTYVKRVAVSTTMGPGVHVDPASVNAGITAAAWPSA